MRLAVPIAVVLIVLVAVPIVIWADRDNDDREVNPLAPSGTDAVSPSAINRTPERWFRQPVVVRGEVTAVGEERAFALSGPEGAILVVREPGVDGARDGATVEVRGVVNYVSRVQATDLGEVGTVRTDAGAPYVSADQVLGP